MNFRIAFLFLLNVTISVCQTASIDCINSIDKVPYILAHANNSPDLSKDSLLNDMNILKECGHLDSIDTELIIPFTAMSLMNSTVVTYRTLIDLFNQVKKADDYKALRKTVIIFHQLEKKIVTPATLEEDQQTLKSMLPPNEIEGFKSFIKNHSDQPITYKEAFEKYHVFKSNEEKESLIYFTTLIDLENALNKGREQNKRVLIYFSAYADVNSRKMESTILSNEQIKTFLSQNYICFLAMEDDKSPDPENPSSTIGKKYMKLQFEKFKTNSQPYFYILDEKGNILSEITFTRKVDDFLTFLKKGMH
jgi:hypothetical protein